MDIYVESEEKKQMLFAGENPLVIAKIALFAMTEFAIDANVDKSDIKLETTIKGKKYMCKMVCTYEEIV